MTDVVTLGALAFAVVFVLAVVYFLGKQKKETPRGAYVSDFELSLSSKKDKKKEKKKPAPKAEKSPAVPIVSRRLKGVEGALDDSDEHMISFLNQKITLETKRSDAKRESDEPASVQKPKKEKTPKQPAEAVEKGYTAVVDRKKPAKEKEEVVEKPVEEGEAIKKKPAKAFYKADQEAADREFQARKAEREKEKKERGDRPPRPPRGENGPNNLPPRLRKEGSAAGAEGAEGAEAPRERKPRPEGAPRPKREVPAVAPAVTEPFEEWSIDSMLDSITSSAPEPKKKKAVAPAEVAVADQ